MAEGENLNDKQKNLRSFHNEGLINKRGGASGLEGGGINGRPTKKIQQEARN